MMPRITQSKRLQKEEPAVKKYSVVGIDVSDKDMKAVALDSEGEVVLREVVACRKAAMKTAFGQIEPCLIVLETGTQTGWLSHELIALGHEVVVANSRKVKAIWADERKNDWRDAETLARLGRSDRKLLHPVVLRSAAVQADLSVLRARNAAVRARVLLVNTTRSLVKGVGERVPACSTEAFARRCRETVSESGRTAIESLLTAIEAMTVTIRDYDRQIKATAQERYSEAVTPMSAVPGVGIHTALAYALTIENP
jgi:transposase